MDDDLLRKALGTLEAFTNNLPPLGDIEESYVNLYHKTLTEISSQTGHDLDYFRIPSDELNYHVASSSSVDPDRTTYSPNRFCARSMFLIKLNSAINYLVSFLSDPHKRIIGF